MIGHFDPNSRRRASAANNRGAAVQQQKPQPMRIVREIPGGHAAQAPAGAVVHRHVEYHGLSGATITQRMIGAMQGAGQPDYLGLNTMHQSEHLPKQMQRSHFWNDSFLGDMSMPGHMPLRRRR